MIQSQSEKMQRPIRQIRLRKETEETELAYEFNEVVEDIYKNFIY